MNKKQDLIASAVSIALGALLIAMKGNIISIALTVAGVSLIAFAVIDILHGGKTLAVIKGVLGVCILVFGWVFINLALYIVGGFMIASGLMQIVNHNKPGKVIYSKKQQNIELIKSIMLVLAGACLLFNQGAAVDWVFVVSGVLLIIQGIMGVIEGAK